VLNASAVRWAVNVVLAAAVATRKIKQNNIHTLKNLLRLNCRGGFLSFVFDLFINL